MPGPPMDLRSPTPTGAEHIPAPKVKREPQETSEETRTTPWWFNSIGIQAPILRGFDFSSLPHDATRDDSLWHRLSKIDQVILACYMDLEPFTNPWDPCTRERFAAQLSVYFCAAIRALDRPLSPLLHGGIRDMEMVCRVGSALGLELIGGAPQAEAYLAMMVVRRYADAYARFQRLEETLGPEGRHRRNQEFDLLCRSRGYPGYFVTETPCRCPQLYVAGHKVEANQPVLRELVATWIVRVEAAEMTVAAA